MAITLHTDVTDLPEQTEEVQGRDRDDFQRQVDKHVADLKAKTATLKWPAHDPAKLFHRYVVDATDANALKSVIRRAATLHKVEPAFYKNAKTEAGHIVVKFHLDRKPVRKDGEVVKNADGSPKFVADDTLNTDGTPKTK